jgi:asparagine synthase (glutamine-hydrolysing)
VRCLRYWRWDSIEPSSLTRKAQLERSHNQFLKAVQRRLRNDKEVLATLSGGLDSRSVVSALRNEGVKVNTLNFYRVLESQDQVFAADFAKAAGANHRAVPLPPWNAPAPFEQRVTNAWESARSRHEAGPERPQLLWMGDGGSVGVGHVFVEDNVVAALREGQVEKAIHAYRPRMVSRLLRDGSSSSVSELMVEDIRAELEDLRYEDPARAFHMFLMLYEQRYDLSQHFENLDLHRLEFQLPFFDFDFLASIVSAPVDWCLEHGFYMDWLALFPASATAVPWQAYPSHRPCPLPIPEGLSYQWGKTKSTLEIEAKRRELLNTADQVLGAGNFPDPILKKYFLQVTTWLYKAGLRDGGSTIKAAQTYHHYWAACQGEFAVGSASSWNCA